MKTEFLVSNACTPIVPYYGSCINVCSFLYTNSLYQINELYQYHVPLWQKKIKLCMAHKGLKQKSRRLRLLCLFVMQQMHHDYHFYSVISHSIQHCTFRIFIGISYNYNSMKMLGAFPVESYGELGRYPLFKDWVVINLEKILSPMS